MGSRNDLDQRKAAGKKRAALLSRFSMGQLAMKAEDTAQLEQFIESFPVPIAMLDSQGRVILANCSFHDALRLDRQGSNDRTFCELLRPVDGGGFARWRERMAEGRDDAWQGELVCSAPQDGHKLYGQIYPLREQNYYFAILDGGLRPSRGGAGDTPHPKDDFFLGILNSSPDLIICTDRHGKIIFVNQAGEKKLGYNAQELLGRHISAILAEDREEIRQKLRHIRGQRMTNVYEALLLHRDGKCLPFQFSLTPLHETTQDGFLGIGREASGARDLEKELHRRGEELEELVYIITHNLKSPIVSVQGFATLLQEENSEKLDDDGRHYLERIQINVETMNTIISNLLQFSKYGNMEIQFGQVDLKSVVQNVVNEVQAQEPEAGIRFEMPERLPKIFAHEEGLKTVFENLINNAAKYRSPDRQPLIRIESQEFPKFYSFHIRDNGIGLEPEFLERAFKIFQRGGNVGDREGTGLGLSICRKIVERHGGLIAIYSKLGEGTRVSFTIPKNEVVEHGPKEQVIA